MGFGEEDSVGVGLIGGRDVGLIGRREVGLRRIGGVGLPRAVAKEATLPRKENNPEFAGS